MEQTQPSPVGVLPTDAALRLRRMLRFLRIEQKVNYTRVANFIKIDVDKIYAITAPVSRSVGTYEILRGVEGFCRSKNIVYRDESFNDEQSGFDYILDSLHMDQELIAASIRRVEGRYLLFSLLDNHNVAVTWIELFGTSKKLTVPVFKGRRIGRDGHEIIYKGFYYEYKSTLFIYGHIAGTPLTRSIVLVPAGHPRTKDRQGVMTGASDGDALFVSACYLTRLGENTPWKDHEHLLGEKTPDSLHEQFGYALESITARANLCASVHRGSG